MREISEIVEVKPDGTAIINTPFKWDPAKDIFFFKKQSKVFEKIALRKGLSLYDLQKELMIRAKLLYELYKKQIFGFEEVQQIINEYYKSPQEVLKRYGL